MLVTVPLIFSAEVTSRSASAKVRTIQLHERHEIEIDEISEDDAPIATEWNDKRLLADGRTAVTRHHDGRHFRRLHEKMFDGFHAMAAPMSVAALRSRLHEGVTPGGPFAPLGDQATFHLWKQGEIKRLYDVEDRYADIDRTDLIRRRAELDIMSAGLAVIGGHIWYECSEPTLIVVPPANSGDIHRILITTEDDPLYELMLARGAVMFRADRHEDAVAMIEDGGATPTDANLSARVTIHMPETIRMDDDAEALERCADAVIEAVGSQVARLMSPRLLTALADLMRARKEDDLLSTGSALASLADATDLSRHGTDHEAVLARWAQREREFILSF